MGIASILITVIWLFAVVDCIRNESGSERWLWLLAILFFNIAGAIAYLLVRRLFSANLPTSPYVSRWTRRQELWTAEANARTIGKAYQFVVLGNLLCDLGQFERASHAYDSALEKEPQNAPALWGASVAAMQLKQFETARQHLEGLMAVDPSHRSGDASLAYSKTLMALKDWPAAEEHLERDVQQWGHPESYLLLAQLREQQEQFEAARDCLETMLARVRGSTLYHYKRHRPLVRKAERQLRKLRRAGH